MKKYEINIVVLTFNLYDKKIESKFDKYENVIIKAIKILVECLIISISFFFKYELKQLENCRNDNIFFVTNIVNEFPNIAKYPFILKFFSSSKNEDIKNYYSIKNIF